MYTQLSIILEAMFANIYYFLKNVDDLLKKHSINVRAKILHRSL